ncbi:hypothetical protein [Embleya scabrispora]|uniref:hypothetical protein n=1 Tax=Embleya scabrispora TaxID=159449 RepID=UPI0003616270|nr:hypothetical protein [Embleya scabrispora]MYS79978.1 hypothetical protein [Streptomyces sp. SID5474]
MARDRLPDGARNAAARTGVLLALTIVAAMVALLGVWAHTWFWVWAMLFVGLGMLGMAWSALEILIALQVAEEQQDRDRGVYQVRPVEMRPRRRTGR